MKKNMCRGKRIKYYVSAQETFKITVPQPTAT